MHAGQLVLCNQAALQMQQLMLEGAATATTETAARKARGAAAEATAYA